MVKFLMFLLYVLIFFVFFIIMLVFQNKIINELNEKHEKHKHINKYYEYYKNVFVTNSNLVICGIFFLTIIPFITLYFLNCFDYYYSPCDSIYFILLCIIISFIFFIAGIPNLHNLQTILNNNDNDLNISSNLTLFLASVYIIYIPPFLYLLISCIKIVFGYRFLFFGYF